MISRLRGTLLSRADTGVEIATAGGVIFEVDVPLSVFERLPDVGVEVEIRTVQVVREDSIALYGFLDLRERRLFQTLLSASGVGARLALAMLSTYSAPRLVRALLERDVATLVQVPGVGKKTAERLAIELGDRVKGLDIVTEETDGSDPDGAHEAVHALVALGMSFQEAESAIRLALDGTDIVDAEELLRKALSLR